MKKVIGQSIRNLIIELYDLFGIVNVDKNNPKKKKLAFSYAHSLSFFNMVVILAYTIHIL